MSYLEVNINSLVPIYQQIMDQLRRLVSEGTLSAGAPLPSVRQLAAELAINPNTVAKAYQLLELEGTIVTLRRRGAFVGASSSAKAALARDRRLEEVVTRLAEDAARLGLEGEEIIQAFAERLRQGGQQGPAAPGTGGTPGTEGDSAEKLRAARGKETTTGGWDRSDGPAIPRGPGEGDAEGGRSERKAGASRRGSSISTPGPSDDNEVSGEHHNAGDFDERGSR